MSRRSLTPRPRSLPIALTLALWGGPLPARAQVCAAIATTASDPTESALPALARNPSRPEPWRLEHQLGLPSWLGLSLEHRARYESLSTEIRAGLSGSNQLLALRTLLEATARRGHLRITGELIDSRQVGAPDDAVLDTTLVDAVDLLQGYIGWNSEDVFSSGDALDVRVGRQTIDIGSRRLVARNAFRNTINAFTGLHAELDTPREEKLRAFVVSPVQRLPQDQQSLQDNDLEFDEELDQVLFYGVHAMSPTLVAGSSAELYAFRLDEDDGDGQPSRNRRLWTIGARVVKEPESGHFDFEWESAFQFGESRRSAGRGDTTDLDHNAQFHHLGLGYRFDAEWEPRLEALVDYASGDDSPDDDANNRFDTLFGARRFEFGPTGILGAFARSNIISPGARLTAKPGERIRLMLAHRLYYLASDRDAWTTTGLADPSGGTNRFLGQLAELSARYEVVPKTFQVEVGIAQLFAGPFVDDAPNATEQGDSTYGYLQTTLRF